MANPPLRDTARAVRLAAFLHTRTRQGAGRMLHDILGISPVTVAKSLTGTELIDALPELRALLKPETRGAAEAEPEDRLGRHDLAFWRRRAAELQREHDAQTRVIEELAGVRRVPVTVPEWAQPPSGGRRGRSVVGCQISDIHDGEVIRPEEIRNFNGYSPEVAEARLRRYAAAACSIGTRWAEDTDCEGVLLTLGGDLISGDIHEELVATNALTSHEQVQHCAGIIEALVRALLGAFARVHVVGVPGNHGRTTRKPHAKRYGALSYDILICSMVADRLRSEERVTWQFGASKDQVTPIFGRRVLTTHGDKIGTGGGLGFAGPVLPITRGTKKVHEQSASAGLGLDLVLTHHWHSTHNPYVGGRPVLANGSVVGYGEYSDDLRVALEPPQQWLYLLHDRWWLRERLAVQLEEPGRPAPITAEVPEGWA